MGGMPPLAWTSCTTEEIEQTRLNRQVRRLKQRLASLRRGSREMFAADIAALEAELSGLRQQLATGSS